MSDICCGVVQGVELGNIGPDEATKGIESLQTSASQDLSASLEAPQLQVQQLHTKPTRLRVIPRRLPAWAGAGHSSIRTKDWPLCRAVLMMICTT